ncbi:diacylglycerol/lipid kinase family protein [Serinicoccus marinus]|uniref:diacylglycerol/lipid kinase family protein n=1 Tax=Serinicoccus marinus TaxID=247333 RepID=UPI0024931356|nr:diacylglycerol kinase family protein [Serinicoccus marinus]
MPTVGLVLNPAARGAERARAEVAIACAEAALPPPLVRSTTVADPGPGQTRELLALGCRRLVVAGGDGTVREVVGATDPVATVGIVPCGTADLAARSLRLPLRARPAARLAVGADASPVDVGRVEVWQEDGSSIRLPFLVVVGVGHDAEVLASLSPVAKARLGWLAYVTPGLRRLHRPGRTVEVRVDDAVEQQERAWSVLAVNGGRLPLGARLVPGARMDDGLLHVAVVAPRRLREWGRVAATGVGVRHREHPALRYRSGQVVEVRMRAPGPLQVDGDVVPRAVSARITIEPGAVRVARER